MSKNNAWVLEMEADFNFYFSLFGKMRFLLLLNAGLSIREITTTNIHPIALNHKKGIYVKMKQAITTPSAMRAE